MNSPEYLLDGPSDPSFVYVFGHGAGAGMRHRFMDDMSARLVALGAAVLRYEFPYMQRGGGRPDAPGVLGARVREAIRAAEELEVPIIAGGKSMGGRMTSQLLARDHSLPVRGLAFVGFPLHQPNQPGRARAAHLFEVKAPMLFLQGTRDALADLSLIEEVTAELGRRATLHVVDGADHSFAVLKRSGRTNDEVMQELAETLVSWSETRIRTA